MDEEGIPDAIGGESATVVGLKNQDGSDGAGAGEGESRGGCVGTWAGGEGTNGASSAVVTLGMITFRCESRFDFSTSSCFVGL